MALAFAGPSPLVVPRHHVGVVPELLKSKRNFAGGLVMRAVSSGKRTSSAALPRAFAAVFAAAASVIRAVSKRLPRVTRRAGTSTKNISGEVLALKQLGGSPFDKALFVNLDPTFYGSFAEIGAAQEVSRTFLTAGAAAGTVARSLSAYDMKVSDVTYGKATRYVTQERLAQMVDTEYRVLEETLRETKGEDCRFFAFATTLAAKAYMSTRECEGWVGIKFQHQARAEPSSVTMHIRMSGGPGDTAQIQGADIGVLGTNLIYLCNFCKDPYLIASFLLDGVEEGHLEVDLLEFSGPGFPEGSADPRLLAMRLVQYRVAKSVLLDLDKTGKYKMSVPNNALYKRTVVVQQSRFRPVTYAHREVMEAAEKQLKEEMAPGSKPPLQILNLQIDDIVRPPELVQARNQLENIRNLLKADQDGDGLLTSNELRAIAAQKLPELEVDELLRELENNATDPGYVCIDGLVGLSSDSALVSEFLDRFTMLEALKFPVLISGLRRTHTVAEYLARYTKEQIVVTVGGGNYSIERGMFNAKSYADEKGGMLEAFGLLFKGNVRILQYPNISLDGEVSTNVVSAGTSTYLHQYLMAEGKIVPIDSKFMTPLALDKKTNEPFRGQSEDVVDLIKAGNESWTKYVPEPVAKILRSRPWYQRLSSNVDATTVLYKFLKML